MVSQNLGRVQPLYRGNYNSSVSYDRLDNVLYNQETWICLVDGTQGEAPNASSSKWELIAGKGGTGPQGPSGGFGTVVATATTLLSTEAATASVVTNGGPETAKNFSFSFGIPAGPVGFDVNDIKANATNNSGSATASAAIDSNGKLGFIFNIPPAEGTGVAKVDNIEPSGDSRNVVLNAVRYTSQSLSDAQKAQVRTNIGAQPSGNYQIAGDYIINPSDKTYGQYLQYAGTVANPSWIATTINTVPNGGLANYILRKQNNGYGWTPVYELPNGGAAGAMLIKNSSNDYDCGWASAISSSEIDVIINE